MTKNKFTSVAITTLLLMLLSSEAWSGARFSTIELKTEMMSFVNSLLPGNLIHWCKHKVESDCVVLMRYSDGKKMVSVIKGDYEYTIYKFTYEVVEEVKGKLPDRTISFYVERKFPTPESGIKYKELWPLTSTRELKFSIDIKQPHHIIKDICMKKSA